MSTENNQSRRRYWIVMVRGLLRFAVIIAAMLWLAGRLDYWQVWVYGATGMIYGLAIALLFVDKSDLIEERLRPGPGTKWWDRVFYAFYIPGFLAVLAVAPLDVGRFDWSPPLPAFVYVMAYAALLAAYVFVTWAMYVNRFFSSVVRIQTDRGQTVVEDGPYRFVRHPGYVGAIVLSLSSATTLGSLWALVPAGLLVPVIVVRTALEDATLQRELPGYADYASRVRYRLLPGVW